MAPSAQEVSELVLAQRLLSPEENASLSLALEDAIRLGYQEQRAFFAEFTSLHLPQVLKKLRLNLSSVPLKSTFVLFLEMASDKPAFARWVRSLGYQEGVNFLKELLEWINQHWSELDVDFASLSIPLSQEDRLTLQSLGQHCGFLLSVVVHIPRDPSQSAYDLVSSFKHPGLARNLASATSSGFLQSTQVQEFFGRWNVSAVAFVQDISSSLHPARNASFLESLNVTWLSCEVQRTLGAPPCPSLPVGEEMMACGKCHSVRYCSRDHQRADWKQHKIECFKPMCDFGDLL